MTNSRAKVVADDWVFVDPKALRTKQHLPLFISRVLAVSKNGRQFITQFDHIIDDWVLDKDALSNDDYIIAWTQIEHPKFSEDI
jgi:hypothetical protein